MYLASFWVARGWVLVYQGFRLYKELRRTLQTILETWAPFALTQQLAEMCPELVGTLLD